MGLIYIASFTECDSMPYFKVQSTVVEGLINVIQVSVLMGYTLEQLWQVALNPQCSYNGLL